MAKKKKSKKRYGGLILTLCMILYAMIAFVGIAYGLEYLWGVMEAYESSRAYHAIDGYMEQLDADYVAERSQALVDQIDHHIQSEEECRDVIRSFVKDGITYAKKSKECTDTKQVFVLRSGGKVIGQFQIEMQGQATHGFTPWKVTGDSFDLSFLITATVSTLAPHNYPVYVNGSELTDSYITETDIRYELLEDFYDEYTLPYMVTYEAGPCLGEISLEVKDTAGNPVVIDENTDRNTFLDNCTADEKTRLDAFIDTYINRYVAFMSNYGSNTNYNLSQLQKYIVDGTTLEHRMNKSTEGLSFVHTSRIVIDQININHKVAIGDGRYICDIDYSATLDTNVGNKGTITTGGQFFLIVVESENGLLAETMVSY